MSNIELACIGVDQSYQRTGISISADGKLLAISSVDVSKLPKPAARATVASTIAYAIGKCSKNGAKNILVLLERIRMFSQNFVSMPYILSMGAMNGSISDCIYNMQLSNIELMSVDTRAWKRSVVGTTKEAENEYGVPPKKWPTIEHLLSNYDWVEEKIMFPSKSTRKTKKNFKVGSSYYEYDNDAADSACISLFPFSRPDYYNLLEAIE